MSSQSPAIVVYSSLGVEITAANGAAVPSTQAGLLIDGYNYSSGLAQLISVNGSGDLIVTGSGIAGTAATGVITIQGIASMTPVVVSGTVSVSGTVAVTQSTSPWVVSGTVTSNQGTANSLANAWPVELTDGTNVLGTNAHPVVITGSVVTSKSSTGTITSVPGSITSVTLLASNANRISATIFNDAPSGNILYVALSASSSTVLYTVKLWPGSYWELPVDYTGIISGIWTANTGDALVTELT